MWNMTKNGCCFPTFNRQSTISWKPLSTSILFLVDVDAASKLMSGDGGEVMSCPQSTSLFKDCGMTTLSLTIALLLDGHERENDSWPDLNTALVSNLVIHPPVLIFFAWRVHHKSRNQGKGMLEVDAIKKREYAQRQLLSQPYFFNNGLVHNLRSLRTCL